MKKISQLGLLMVVAAGCGSSDNAMPDARPIADSSATFEAFPEDGGPVDLPALEPDGGSALDLPSGSMDASSVDGNGDATSVLVDGSAFVDAGRDARTLTLADGRTLTYVDTCQLGSLTGNDSCPQSYALGLAEAEAKVQGPPPPGRPPALPPGLTRTGAGRCAEGSYVYAPYMDTSAEGCYYDATTQLLIGHEEFSDYPLECENTDTLSNVFVIGTEPPCSAITWEVYGDATYY